MGRTAAAPQLSAEQRSSLEQLLRAGNTPQKYVMRARIALRAADDRTNDDIARTVGCSIPAVIRWRRRVAALGPEALKDAPRPGRPRRYDDEMVSKIVAFGMQPPPEGEGTHWSTRRAANQLGVERSAVQRLWRAHRLL